MADPGPVTTADREQPLRAECHPLVLVLDRLRSAHNVGNIYRLAEVCRIRELISCGYTAAPPHPKLEKTARGCDRLVANRQFDTSADAARSLKDQGYHIVAVETVAGAPAPWEHRFHFPCALVLGNEALGIDSETLSLCEATVCLPVFGTKNSLNVSNCAAVVVYAALQQLSDSGSG